MVTNADITVFNKSVANDGNRWIRRPVRDVFWQENKKMSVGSDGFVSADITTVFIPFSSAPDLVVRKGDIIARNVIIFEIDESEKLSNLKALRHKYNDVMTVMSVSKRDYGTVEMRHWEVVIQ